MFKKVARSRPKILISQKNGEVLIELVLAIAIAAVLLTSLTTGAIAAREAFARSGKNLEATLLLQKEIEAIRSVKETAWNSISNPGTYHVVQSGNGWAAATGTTEENGYTRSFTVENICRQQPTSPPVACGEPGAQTDPSTKKVTANISWSFLGTSSVSSTLYISRYSGNQAWAQTTKAEFDQGIHQGTIATNNSGGEVQIDFSPPPPPSCLDGYWQDPVVCDTYNTPGGDGAGVFVVGNYAYMVSSGSGADFFIFNISDPQNISLTGSLDLGATAYNVYVSGNYAYVATDHNSRELTVVNVTNKANPTIVGGGYNTPGNTDGYSIFVVGNTAYLGRQNGSGDEFYAINVSNPLSPTLLDSFAGNSTYDIYVQGNYAYLASADNSRELDILNISNPSNITRVGSFNTPGTADGQSVFVSGSVAYLTTRGGGDDIYAINVSNPANPSLLDSLELGGNAWEVYMVGNLAFVGTDSASSEFQVIDVSDPSNLILYGFEDLNGSAIGVFVVGDFAYIANSADNAEFQIIKGGSPPIGGSTECAGSWYQPEVCKTHNTPGADGRGITVNGDYAYMVSGGGGDDFFIFDITDPENFTLVGSLVIGAGAYNVQVAGNYAYVATADDTKEMIVIDISNKSSPSIIGSYDAPGRANGYGIFAKGTTAYLTTGGSGDDLHILDVTNPASPSLISSMELGGNGYDITVSGDYAYIASSNNSRELDVINISDPYHPTRAGYYNASGTANGLSVHLVGTTAYLTTQNSGAEFYILNVTNLNNILLVGSLDLGGDGNDVFVDRSLAFAATSNGSSEFQVIDISNPSNPSLYGSTNLNGVSLGVFVFGDYAVIGNADNNAEFQVIKGGPRFTASFISSSFNAGSVVGFNYLTWTATLQAQTSVRFQIATNNDNSTWDFGGPDGTRTTFFYSPGAIALNSISARYIRYKIFLSSNVSGTSPVVEDVTINYSP